MKKLIESLMRIKDAEVRELLLKELKRQQTGAELIASENFASLDVLRTMGTWVNNKYAEGYPGKRYYGGCEVVDEIEQLAIDRFKQIFNCTYANVQLHSGASANTAVYFACLKPGDKILGLDLSKGGHLTHGAKVNISGKWLQSFHYGLDEDGFIDYNEMESLALEHKPKIIVCGASAYSRDWDYARIREIANQIDAIVMADIAHPAGLIAMGLLDDPFDHCHIVTSTTHKTLRGPRGGLIMLRNDFENPLGEKNLKNKVKTMSESLDSAVFPGLQGGPLEHVIAAKAVAAYEILQPEYRKYAHQILVNASAMAERFMKRGYNIVSGGTSNHLMLIDLRNKNITGKKAQEVLGKAGITVNKNTVPNETQSPFVTSGIRIGVPAVTTLGMDVNCMQYLVQRIDQVLTNPDNEKLISITRDEIQFLMKKYPLYPLMD